MRSREIRSASTEEVVLGRVINPESASKERTRLTRAVVLAIRELMRQTEPNGVTRDLAAFIALALESVAESIDPSVEAWEKRGYWLKADRFRMEWAWTEKLGKAMRQAISNEDWPSVAMTAAQVAEKLKSVEVPQRHRLGTPWEGAWDKMRSGT
jgi:hypothetical protein